jgi:DNA-binding NtrC family response regulator
VNVTSRQKRRLEGPSRPTAVIVDREALYRWFVSEALGQSEVHVVQCPTLDDADAFLRRQRPDLLIADETTVRVGGPAAVEHLSALARSIPCLVLASSGASLCEQAVVVDKPVDAQALSQLVARELQLHRL